jgi:hypothetical protein
MSDAPLWVAAVAGSVAAVGTTGAVIYTAVGLGRERLARRRGQADRVGAWVDASQVRTNAVKIAVSIRNTSDLPVAATPVVNAIWPKRDLDTSTNPFSYTDDQVMEAILIGIPMQVNPGATVVSSTTLSAEGDDYSLEGHSRLFLTGSPVWIALRSLYVKDNAQRLWRYQLDPPKDPEKTDSIKPTGPPLPTGLTLSPWH